MKHQITGTITACEHFEDCGSWFKGFKARPDTQFTAESFSGYSHRIRFFAIKGDPLYCLNINDRVKITIEKENDNA